MEVDWTTAEFAELGCELLYAVLRLRQAVFVVEQHSVYLDLDNRDQHCLHMLCRDTDGALLAYQRCAPPGVSYPESSIGRIVVAPAQRGRRLGRELVRRGVAHNLSRWPDRDILISAQAHLQDFYASEGFSAEGDEYLEDGILHRRMRLRRD